MASIVFATRQLTGPIDFAKWRQSMRGVSDLHGEVAYVKAVETAAAGARPADPRLTPAVMAADATQAVAAFMRDIIRSGVDTTDPAMWAGLADAVSCTARLTMTPEIACGDGVTVRDMAMAVAVVLDMVCRLADDDVRHTAMPSSDTRKQLARVAQIYVDLVNGRAAFWHLYCRLEGSVAAAVHGQSFVDVYEGYANMRTGALLEAFARAQGDAGEAEAEKALIAYTLAAQTISERVCGEGRDGFDISACLRRKVVEAAQKSFMEEVLHAACQGFGGYAGMLAVSPTTLVAALPIGYDEPVMKSVAAMQKQGIGA